MKEHGQWLESRGFTKTGDLWHDETEGIFMSFWLCWRARYAGAAEGDEARGDTPQEALQALAIMIESEIDHLGQVRALVKELSK